MTIQGDLDYYYLLTHCLHGVLIYFSFTLAISNLLSYAVVYELACTTQAAVYNIRQDCVTWVAL